MKSFRFLAALSRMVAPFLAAMLVASAFVSCGESKVTAMLDKYERAVEKIEGLDPGDSAKFERLREETEEISAALGSLEGDEQWTGEERARWLKLTGRCAKAMARQAGGAVKNGVKDGLKALGL